jgi:transcriptional antiterminator RfaH
MQGSKITVVRVREAEQIGWYLVFTKANHEAIAEQHLQRQGFDIYLPLLQQHKRRRNQYKIVTEPLFPRYLFIHLHSEMDDWSKIRSTRGCVSLVRFGPLPARVPENLIQRLKQDEGSRIIQEGVSTPDFQPGDHVQVVDGVLTNYEGIVKIKNSQQRITLLLTVTEGYTRSVNLSVHQIKKVVE